MEKSNWNNIFRFGVFVTILFIALGCEEEPNGTLSSAFPPETPPVWSYIGLETERISVIHPDSENPDELLVGSMSSAFQQVGGLFRTTDRGENWDTLFYGGSITDIECDPNNDQRIFITSTINAMNPPGLFKSDDGGTSWDTLNLPAGVIDWTGPSALSINPDNSEDLLLGISGISGGGLYRSLDGGNSWNLASDSAVFAGGITALTRHPNDPSVVFVGTDWVGALYKSTDYGVTWRRLDVPELWIVHSIAIYQDCPDTMLVGSDKRGVWISKDGGETWSDWNNGFDPASTVPSIVITKVGGVYAAIDNQPEDLAKVYATNISGGDWRKVGDFISTVISTVAIGIDSTLYIGSYWMMMYN